MTRFQHGERRSLNPPVAERRLSLSSQEHREQAPWLRREIFHCLPCSTVAPRICEIIALFPALMVFENKAQPAVRPRPRGRTAGCALFSKTINAGLGSIAAPRQVNRI